MDSANTFQSLKPLFKETYSRNLSSPTESKYWKKLKKLIKKPGKK